MSSTKMKKEEAHNVVEKATKQDFNNIVKQYVGTNPYLSSGNKTNELEIRFGTNHKLRRPITKNNYDNVIQKLNACGFKAGDTKGLQLLRIQSEYLDANGRTRMSNVRAEIVGNDMIQQYCETNDISKLINMPSTLLNKIKFTKKMPAYDAQNQPIRKVDMNDFNFRVSFQTEQDFHTSTAIGRSIISKWRDNKKIFRLINRVRFEHPQYPVFADVSIVKTSKRNNYIPIPQYTIQDAGVLDNVEQYEIELEVDNSRVGNGTPYSNPELLLQDLRKCIRFVLSGLQQTPYPISYYECTDILNEYVRIVHGKDEDVGKITSKYFVGPSSYTLQMENIVPELEDSVTPNIRVDYTVTDKADGDRMLCFVNSKGKIYFIDTNMNVRFSGAITKNKQLFSSIVDGEYIKKDKHGKDIHVYAAFDVYCINKKSTRKLPFYSKEIMVSEEDEDEVSETESRYLKLGDFMRKLDAISILDKSHDQEVKPDKKQMSSGVRFQIKEFEAASDIKDIFKCCNNVLSRINDGQLEYETDGLIFTPAYLPVGGSMEDGEPGPLYKSTWDFSFKWKPPQYNTIDLLVSVQKDTNNQDKVYNVFEDGKQTQTGNPVTQYKTLILHCGYDQSKHGYLNPCAQIIQGDLPSESNYDNRDGYKPVPFQPTNPSMVDAHLCNIELKSHDGYSVMTTEDGEYFEENMIVEFKYVHENKDQWKWVPIRVRHDKTAELKAGLRNYGNAYHVANSNWHTIHHPITEDMIRTGSNIPEYLEDTEVYYRNTKVETQTRSLRDFHNLYAKKKLIMGVSNPKDNLIDYAVGKAGDLPKWIRSKLHFVFGIDVSRDNIHNPIDGACARYLNNRKKYNKMPHALFVHGNSGARIRDGTAMNSERDKQTTQAVFGIGSKDKSVLGAGVYPHYAVGEDGFNVSSCQFAIHYFFENRNTLHGFMRNISECTKLDGYFIATTYDGDTVFKLLQDKQKDESVVFKQKNNKVYEIVKLYDQTGLPKDEESLNYTIGIYQESINKVFQEYLVQYDFFVRTMENYGFVLVSDEDAQHMGLPHGSGMFSELYSQMEQEVKEHPERANDYAKALNMNEIEKKISFMNRYYVFKKMNNVNIDKIEKIVSIIPNTLDDDNEVPSENTETPEFPGTPDGTPPAIQIQRAKEAKEKEQNETDQPNELKQIEKKKESIVIGED